MEKKKLRFFFFFFFKAPLNDGENKRQGKARQSFERLLNVP